MSYNLLFNTSFQNNAKNWNCLNCKYENGYLVANSKIYSFSQTLVLTDPTKVYFSMDYIAFDKNIKSIMVGVKEKDVLYSVKKRAALYQRKKQSVVHETAGEQITVMFIIEAKTDNTKIYIDSPVLVDLCVHNRTCWPKTLLDKTIDYRYGHNYENIYKESEISIDNKDFISAYITSEKAKSGILMSLNKTDNASKDWFEISCDFKDDVLYLAKLDYTEVNNCGNIYFKYGETFSSSVQDQLFIIFKGSSRNKLKLYLENDEELPYQINLKHILIVDLTNQQIVEDEVPHLPFV